MLAHFEQKKEDPGEEVRQTILLPYVNKPPLKIAISYAKEDMDECDYLVSTLRIGAKFSVFYDKEINENDWDKQIRDRFRECDLVILLNSEYYNFRSKKYIWEVEMPIILEKLQRPKMSVLRINVNACTADERVLNINDHKRGAIPKERNEKAAFYNALINEVILARTAD